MKYSFAILILLIVSCTVSSQASLKRNYRIDAKYVNFKAEKIKWTVIEEKEFESMTETEKNKVLAQLPPDGSTFKHVDTLKLNGKVYYLEQSNTLDYSTVLPDKTFSVSPVQMELSKNRRGNLSFKKNKIYANPYLISGDDNETDRFTYYYQLRNRQSIKLKFTEWVVSALAIPIKYRFSDKENDIPEDWTVDVNANIFVGKVLSGRTKFMYRKDMDNKINNWRVIFGGLLGISSVTLDKLNTSTAGDAQLGDDEEFTQGVVTIGGSLLLSFNDINLGLSGGWDYAAGSFATRWNYHKRPWIGLTVGYGLVKFAK